MKLWALLTSLSFALAMGLTLSDLGTGTDHSPDTANKSGGISVAAR